MSENREQSSMENTTMHSHGSGLDLSVVDSRTNTLTNEQTQVLKKVGVPPIVETPFSPSSPSVNLRHSTNTTLQPGKFSKQDAAKAIMLQERCRHLCLSLFFSEHAPVRSLGFTSSIGGEGKSFLALVTAKILAHDSNDPVTLIECNWEHPTLHERFGIPPMPGLADWLRGTCDEDDIRYPVDNNLTIIPAGDDRQDAVKLLKQVQKNDLLKIFRHSNELLIVDLPPVITSGYGSLAASLVEAVIVVVRSEVISGRQLAETCTQLKDSFVHGIILNQGNSRIPRWIRHLL
jgi:Mrp family chromosome partitioning ATPase